MIRSEIVSALADLAVERHKLVRTFKSLQLELEVAAGKCPDLAQELVELQALWAAVEAAELGHIDAAREKLMSYFYTDAPTQPMIVGQQLRLIAARGEA